VLFSSIVTTTDFSNITLNYSYIYGNEKQIEIEKQSKVTTVAEISSYS